MTTRRAFVCGAVLAAAMMLLATQATAAPVVSLTPSAPGYAPGGAIDVTVALAGAVDLASFNIEVLLEDVTGGLPGGAAAGHFWIVDLLPDTGNPLAPEDLNIATRPADADYVFGGNTDPTTRASNEVAGPGAYGAVLSDYADDFAGHDTDPGRRTLAAFRIQTAADFTGTLRLTFDTAGLFLDDPTGGPVAGFDPADFDAYEVLITPEPATLALVGAGLALAAVRRRVR
jgi:hypothetical protein